MASAAPQTIPGRWIVTLHPHATAKVASDHMNLMAQRTADPTPFHCRVRHQYDLPEARGYSASFDAATRAEIEKLPEVADIEPVQVYEHCAVATQANAPWGLGRIAQAQKVAASGPYSYTYRDEAAGQGVVCYVADTGINITHTDFGGRATRGPKFVTISEARGGKTVVTSEEDLQGHGTHCAGSIGGNTYGVAKKVCLVSIKIFNDLPSLGPDDDESQTAKTEDIIAALNYVVEQFKATKKPSVVSMSLSGGASDAMDIAVQSAVRQGVVVCVAAGNKGRDAIERSPARAPLAITVGATDIDDQLASFSNYGKMVDILAPGVNITSTWIGSNTATKALNGTSMATPHVSGVSCCLFSDPKLEDKTPGGIVSQILIMADKNKTGGLTDAKTRTINAVLQVNDV